MPGHEVRHQRILVWRGALLLFDCKLQQSLRRTNDLELLKTPLQQDFAEIPERALIASRPLPLIPCAVVAEPTNSVVLSIRPYLRPLRMRSFSVELTATAIGPVS